MKYELAKDIPELEATVGDEITLFGVGDNSYYHVKSKMIVGLKSVLESGDYIRQVPEVGKDYIIGLKSGFVVDKGNLYPVIEIKHIKNDCYISFWAKESYNYKFRFSLGNMKNLDWIRFATPEEVKEWKEKQKPVYEIGGGAKCLTSTTVDGFCINHIYPIVGVASGNKVVIKNKNGKLIQISFEHSSWRYIPPSQMPKTINEVYAECGVDCRSDEQKAIDDIWDIVKRLKESNNV